MAVAGALTRAIGIWTPEPDITIHEGEEGAAVGIGDPAGVGGVAVEESRNDHLGTHHTRNRVAPTTTLAQHLRAVLVIHTANKRTTAVLSGNGVTAHR